LSHPAAPPTAAAAGRTGADVHRDRREDTLLLALFEQSTLVRGGVGEVPAGLVSHLDVTVRKAREEAARKATGKRSGTDLARGH
jgi:hypothetical protein